VPYGCSRYSSFPTGYCLPLSAGTRRSSNRMKIIVIGGGIGGLTTAIALRRVGIESHVYERAPALREVGAGIGLASQSFAGLQGDL
jgi:ribulose 1,5-bisphosphate synthetase/thiazole synthase